jgi:hypothetical protein
MSRTVSLTAVLTLLAVGSANAAPTPYALDLAGSSTGSFLVDPDLAAPAGPSAVALYDFWLSLDSSVGTLEFGPDDLTAGYIEARFLDGVLAGLRSPTGTTAEVTIPAGDFGVAIFLSALAPTAADIDPANAGEGNFTIVSLPDVLPVDDVCCSYGFTQSGPPIPEPGSVFLFVAGAALVAGAIAPRLRAGGA